MSIRVRLLGTAAGGGLPQWNCTCANCQAARTGKIAARTQSSTAISADGKSWFIINASPDLRAQIEAAPALQPRINAGRNSPIAGVLLTNPDLDHVLGLLSLREGAPLRVLATDAVRDILTDSLDFASLLNSFCGVHWETVREDRFPLRLPDDTPSGLSARSIVLPGSPPRFAADAPTRAGYSVAFEITDEHDARLLIAPDVAEITPELRHALDVADAVLFDGSFWSEDELQRINPHARTAAEMGHLPVRDGSLRVLAEIGAPWKIYTHINNTNPMLAADSAERAEVEKAGISIGEDGLEFVL